MLTGAWLEGRVGGDDPSTRVFGHEVFDDGGLVGGDGVAYGGGFFDAGIGFSLFCYYLFLCGQLFLGDGMVYDVVVYLGPEGDLCSRLRAEILTTASVMSLVGGALRLATQNVSLSVVSRRARGLLPH